MSGNAINKGVYGKGENFLKTSLIDLKISLNGWNGWIFGENRE